MMKARTEPVMTKANVDGEEDSGDYDADRSQHTDDCIDDDIDSQQLVNPLITRWSATYRMTFLPHDALHINHVV